MNTYSRCGNWIDYHSYPRTSLARRYKRCTCTPARLQSEEHLAGSLYKLKSLIVANPSFLARLSSGELGSCWPTWLGPQTREKQDCLVQTVCFVAGIGSLFVGYNQMNEISEPVSGIPGQGKGGK